MAVTQQQRQFDERDVHSGLDRGQDDVAVGLNAMRAQITTTGLGAYPTGGYPA